MSPEGPNRSTARGRIMSDALLIVWSLLALVGFAGSAMYSGLETGA